MGSVWLMLPAFAHVLHGILDLQQAMTEQAKRHSLLTKNDFVHVSAEQFACIAQQIALLSKLNVIRFLNVADQSKLMSSMMHDVFGGKWPELQVAELEERREPRRKKRRKQNKQQMPSSPFITKKLWQPATEAEPAELQPVKADPEQAEPTVQQGQEARQLQGEE